MVVACPSTAARCRLIFRSASVARVFPSGANHSDLAARTFPYLRFESLRTASSPVRRLRLQKQLPRSTHTQLSTTRIALKRASRTSSPSFSRPSTVSARSPMSRKYICRETVGRMIEWRGTRGILGARFSTRERGPGGSTIYALSSGHGKCGVAVVRVSGGEALEALCNMTKIRKLEPRRAFLRNIYDPCTNEIIDKGLCLWFPGPNSFTGEDCVEFQVHGSSAVLSSLMSALSKLKFRPALPGEFTRRAFYNNKLDLVEIEGLADLIHAETEQQRKQAILQAHGSLSELYSSWRQLLCRCIANLEAVIDFSEEDNIDSNVLQECNRTLNDLAEKIKAHLSDHRKGEILRNGVRTVILGEPNVGKSSLLNRLVQRNAVIVTPIAGTTRDVIELSANISGYPVVLADTAGLTKDTSDVIEHEGIRRARDHASQADFVILLASAAKFVECALNYDQYIQSYIKSLELNDLLVTDGEPVKQYAVVMNKVDLLGEDDQERLKKSGAITLSCKTEEGFPDFMKVLSGRFEEMYASLHLIFAEAKVRAYRFSTCLLFRCGSPSRENPTISQARYRTHLAQCLQHISAYLEMSSLETYDMVLAVEEVRMAVRELGKITGHVNTEEILDIIFKHFCIGK